MDKQVLEQKSHKSIVFEKKIKKEDEELFIMRYKTLIEVIPGLIENFYIDVTLFKDLIIQDGINKDFCKFYFIQINDTINIGMALSNNIDFPVKDDDKLYVLDSKCFIKKDKTNFEKLVDDFNNGINLEVIQNTKTETKMVYYKLEKVKEYIGTLELHFDIENLKFNMFQYSEIDMRGNQLPDFIDVKDRISFCVHAQVKDLTRNITIESIGYDFGTIYP